MARTLRLANATAVNPFTDEQQLLYRAYSQCYLIEANHRHITFILDLAFAAVATTTAVLVVTDASQFALEVLRTWSPSVALCWLVIRESFLFGNDKEHRLTAVTIQEQFDLSFWKPNNWRDGWNHLLNGDPVQPRTINELSQNYQGESLVDRYWVDTTGIPSNDAALLRIQQSCGWGARGHARYSRLNRTAAIASLTVVVAAVLVSDLRTRDAATVLMAAAPFLVGRAQSAREHASLTRRREKLERHIQKLLRGSVPATERDVRSAQDELFRMRLKRRRIPTYLYNRYTTRDRGAIDKAVAQDAKSLRSQYRNPPDAAEAMRSHPGE